MSNNVDEERFPSNESYSVFYHDVETKGGAAKLITLEMHGRMSFDTLNPILEDICERIEDIPGNKFLYFVAKEGASIGTPMTNLQLTTSIGKPKTPFGRFVRVINTHNIPILTRTSDSGLSWLIGAAGSVAKQLKIPLHVIDVPSDKIPEDIVKQVMER